MQELAKVMMSDVHYDDTFNCRGRIDPTSVFDLAKSIKMQGLIQPIVVRTFNEGEETFGCKYKLIAGFRRYTAHKSIQFDTISAVIHTGITDHDAKFINIAENLDRKDLNIMQESDTIRDLLKSINPKTGDFYTELDICERIGKSRGWVQPRVMLQRMPKQIQELAEKGFLHGTAIRDLNKYSDEDDFNREARRLIDKSLKAKSPGWLKVKVPSKSKRNPAMIRKKRSRVEVIKVIDYLVANGFEGHAVIKGMAWAAGELSDMEFLADCQQLVEGYIMPADGLVGVIDDDEKYT